MASAIVTGGSSGIGLAIARMLHDEGYALTLAGRKLERLEAARESLDAAIVQADVSSEEDCIRLVDEHVSIHGGLDVLVNSAGLGIAGTTGDTTTKAWDLQQAVNLRGAFLVTRAALPHLRDTKGYVVNLASIAGTIPTPGLAAYGASKADIGTDAFPSGEPARVVEGLVDGTVEGVKLGQGQFGCEASQHGQRLQQLRLRPARAHG